MRVAGQSLPIYLYTASPSESSRSVFEARIAGFDLLSDQPIAEIESTLCARSMPDCDSLDAMELGAPQFSGQGWLGERLQDFDVWHSDAGQTVAFAEGARFHVGADGSTIRFLQLPASRRDALEVMLGPALLLAMAQRDFFALHASAVQSRQGICLFLGPSGSGKSSLARGFEQLGLHRCADDVTPLVIKASQVAQVSVWPRFPQLKLQPALLVDDREAPLTALIWPRLVDAAVALTPMTAMEASQWLVRDTAAARLFAPQVLARHLQWCAALAQSASIWRLDIPRVAPQHQAALYLELLTLLREQGLL